MVASTDIKFYVHTNTNAPQLQNTYGSLLEILDACLLNGFGAQTITSLVAAGRQVTADFGQAHNFLQYQVINISGATPIEFNGQHRILSVTTNTIKFELATVPLMQIASGVISCSLPALDFECPFRAIGKRAYRSKNQLLPSRPFLRVIDERDVVWNTSYAKYAKVGIVESMTDIDTMLGVQAPYDSNMPNKNWAGTGSSTNAFNGWAKWYYARNNLDGTIDGSVVVGGTDSTAPMSGIRTWTLVGSADFFYILMATTPTSLPVLYGFGGFESYLEDDSSSNFLLATFEYVSAGTNIPPTSMKQSAVGTIVSNIIVQRDYTQSESYALLGSTSLQIRPGTSTITTGSNNYAPASTALNKIVFAQVFLNENGLFRGKMPAINWLFQKKPFNNLDCFNHQGNLYLALDLAVQNNSSYAVAGQVLFQLGVL